MGEGFGVNYAKAYAVYARVQELLASKNYPIMKTLYETVAYEFGYSNQNEINRLVRFVLDNKNHPTIKYHKLIYEGFTYNFVYIYSSEADKKIIEKLINKSKADSSFRIDGRINSEFYRRGYYLYREYEKLQYKKTKTEIYGILAEMFYYQNPVSISHTIDRIKKALNLINEK